jgi:hypothetical protein
MSMGALGKIRMGAKEYAVSCVTGCGMSYVNHLFSRKQFVKYLRADGWRYRRNAWMGTGWVCSQCATQQKINKENEHVSPVS